MSTRFGEIKFNLAKAIELFQDMNNADMDPTDPPSSPDFYKEQEVANRLNDFLLQLIDEGLFDECELRDPDNLSSAEGYNHDEDNEDYDEENSDSLSAPESDGFDYDAPPSSRSASQGSESLTRRFKRYMGRILVGRRGSGGSSSQGRHGEPSSEHSGGRSKSASRSASSLRSGGGTRSPDRHSHSERSRSRSQSRPRSRSNSHSYSYSGPYDPDVVERCHSRSPSSSRRDERRRSERSSSLRHDSDEPHNENSHSPSHDHHHHRHHHHSNRHHHDH